ncbi:hypothetical protein C2S53_012273 [Perilla frutescens var. hirtella]|uniref:Uncharacterized protein n=1 Tax=Perilla frutescens var. hirtella TaxID=608512 RepID=A0AAD4J4K0_PERFH|nr:hypothetical protein C2S53_012273 [Perilla frutescens var. hirtella]
MVIDSSPLLRFRSSRYPAAAPASHLLRGFEGGNIYVLHRIVAGSVYIVAGNASLLGVLVINVTVRVGDPSQPATGTLDNAHGGGGGQDGRGASCMMDNKKLPEEI